MRSREGFVRSIRNLLGGAVLALVGIAAGHAQTPVKIGLILPMSGLLQSPG